MQRCLTWESSFCRTKKNLKATKRGVKEERSIRLGQVHREMEKITDQNIKVIHLEKKESKEQRCVLFPWRDCSKTREYKPLLYLLLYLLLCYLISTCHICQICFYSPNTSDSIKSFSWYPALYLTNLNQTTEFPCACLPPFWFWCWILLLFFCLIMTSNSPQQVTLLSEFIWVEISHHSKNT